MRGIISLCMLTLCVLYSLEGRSQSSPQHSLTNLDSLQKVRIDSIQRKWMKDSLTLSDNIISQVFALRDSCFEQTERIRSNQSLPPASQMQSIGELRKQTDDAIKNLMGETIYVYYKEMIISGRKSHN